MTALLEANDLYLDDFAAFEKALGSARQAPLHKVRKDAFARFRELGFPTTDQEEWRFTNVAPIAQTTFRPGIYEPGSVNTEQVRQLAPETGTSSRLVFVNGHYVPELSSILTLPPGAVVGSLAEALATRPEVVEPHLGKYAGYREHPFAAWNTAFLRDGAFLFLPRGVAVTDPIHLLFIATAGAEPTVSHPRNLILAGEGSQVRVVESYVGAEDAVTLTNAVTEVVLGPGAVVDHYKVQRERSDAYHVATTQVQMARGSNFASQSITLGASLTRNDINAVLADEGCECTLNGLVLGDGDRLIDNHTRIDHARPHCASHELYKTILDGRAKAVFNGKIFVHQDAQKTDAKQTNQTLLLSDDASIDTKPQLEIFADDVKCTHGATVGQLDAEPVFYLRSRGVGLDEARSMLVFAFANDIVGRVQVEPLRAQLEDFLMTLHRVQGQRG